MEIYTVIDEELDRMKREICDPIIKKTEKVVEQFFPMDAEYYQACIDSISVRNSILDVIKSEKDKIIQPFYLHDSDMDIVEFMQLTFDRYGYLPHSMLAQVYENSITFKGFMEELKDLFDKNIDCLEAAEKVCHNLCKEILKKIEYIIEGSEKLNIEESIRRNSVDFEEMEKEEAYINIIKGIGEVNRKFHEIEDKMDLESFIEQHADMDEEEKMPVGLSEEARKEFEEEWSDIRFELQCEMKWWLSNGLFIHRCKCYSNNVDYKTISVQDFFQLCRRENIETQLKWEGNLEKCIDLFGVVERCEKNVCNQMASDRIKYPIALESTLVKLITEKGAGERLSAFSKILSESGSIEKDKEKWLYRKSIAQLEGKIFSESYNYELCCAWNELGGFSLSAVIVERLFPSSYAGIIKQDYVIERKYEEQRERFFGALERCCEILVQFSRSESWLMGLELANIIFGIYVKQWEGKAPALEELYMSMEYMADVMESIPLKNILCNYQYEKQMIGYDGFPRKDFSTLWRDEVGHYQRFFYRDKKDLKKYRDRSKVNIFYIRVFQIVFRCVNRRSLK